MVKIVVDWSRCESFGMCCAEVPDVFSLDEDDKLMVAEGVDESRRAALLVAAEVCPTQAITIE